tara:strand:+ start:4562 stop:6916 length:2355 start_codon:yes stop_codon:yes gene_type:complete
MAYNNNKGPQHSGDIQFEGDPDDTQIDFENDSIKLKTGGTYRLEVNNNHVSASGPVSGSELLTANFVAGGAHISASVPLSASSVQAHWISASAIAGGPSAFNSHAARNRIEFHRGTAGGTSGDIRFRTAEAGGSMPVFDTLTLDYTKVSASVAVSASCLVTKKIFSSANVSDGIILGIEMQPNESRSPMIFKSNAATSLDVDRFRVSSSLPISASSFWNDGELLTGLTASGGNNEVLYQYNGGLQHNYQLIYKPDLERSSVARRHARLELSGAFAVHGATGSSGTQVFATDHPLLYVDYLKRIVGINISGSNLSGVPSGYMSNASFQYQDSGSTLLDHRPRFAIIKSASSYGLAFTPSDVVGEIAMGGTSGGLDSTLPNLIMRAEVDGTTWTSTSRPTRMSFYVTPSGSNIASINDTTNFAMTINSSGNVGCGEKFPKANLHVTASHRAGVSDRTALMVSGTSIFSGSVAIGSGTAGRNGDGINYNLHINSPAGQHAAIGIDAPTGKLPYLIFSRNTELGNIHGTQTTLNGVANSPVMTLQVGNEGNALPGRFQLKMNDNSEGVMESVITINSYDQISALGSLTSSVPIKVSNKVIATEFDATTTVINSTHVSSSLNMSASALYANGLVLSTGSTAQVAVGTQSPVNTNMLFVNTEGNDNRLALYLRDTAENHLLAVSGSGTVVIGGSGAPYTDGLVNITGSDNQKLLTVKSDSQNPALYVSGSGNAFVGANMEISSSLTIRNSVPPTANNSPGTPGEIRWDDQYIYVCTAIDTWKRVQLVGGW